MNAQSFSISDIGYSKLTRQVSANLGLNEGIQESN